MAKKHPTKLNRQQAPDGHGFVLYPASRLVLFGCYL